jgi:alpha-galactosidase
MLNLTQSAHSVKITSKGFEFSLDLKKLSIFYSIQYTHGILTDVTSAILLCSSPNNIQPLFPKLLSESDFLVQNSDFNDSFGKGKRIELACVFESKDSSEIRVAGIWVAKVYEAHFTGLGPFVTIQMILKEWLENMDEFPVYGYAPLYMKESGILNLQLTENSIFSNPQDITFYSNGYQSWSLNNLMTYEDKWQSSPVSAIRINMENQDQLLNGRYQSEWHTVITDTKSDVSVILGFITLKDQFNRILMDHLKPKGEVSWLCAYSQTDQIPLNRLNIGLKRSEELMILFSPPYRAYEALSELCRASGLKQKAKVPQEAVAGWCSWYYYYTKISQNEMVSNLEFFKKRPDIPLGLVQLDDGYQTEVSDWGIDPPYVFNEKFPRGLKWLVEQIHGGNYKAGLWVAPFFTNKAAKIFQAHPDWALCDEKGKYIKTTYNWGNWQYGFDLSRDDVIAHTERIAHTVSHDWGFDFLKIDFLFCSEALNAKYQNPNYSRAQILRRGVESIRRGMTDEKLILGCGAPLSPCVGLVDVMRIGPDTAAVWSPLDVIAKLGKLYIPCLKACLKSTIQRSYMHNTVWTNDPDCVVVRRNKSKLTLEEVLLQLTVFGLSGGQILISDDMPLVDADRIDLFKRLLPAFPTSAKPLDIFKKSLPEIYANTATSNSGKRHLVSIINWEDKPIIKTPKLSELIEYTEFEQYQEDQPFLVIDYWAEKPLGIFEKSASLPSLNIARHGCVFLGIIPIDPTAKSACLAFSTFHIYQGAVDISKFDSNSSKVEIEVKLPGNHEGIVYLFTPSHRKVANSDVPVDYINENGIELIKIPFQFENSRKITLNF